MKKLFSFLCLLMLGAGMSVWAFTPSWTNSELAANQFLGALSGSVDIFVMNYARNASTQPALRLEFILNKTSGTQMYGSIKGPKAGTYSVYNGTSISSNAGKWLGYATNNYYTKYTSSAGNTYTLQSGTITVAEGVGGPYITGYITTSNGNTVVDFVIGTPAPASGEDGTIQVVPGANGEIKVGNGSWQSTTFSQGYTGGSYVTISAQGTGDYVFDQWLEDGNTNATRTITVDGDATYTATFKKLIIHHTFYWANLSEGGTDAEYGSGDGLYVYRLYFTDGGINYPSLDLQLLYDKSKLKDYGSITAPPEGVYNMLNSVYDDFVEFYALGGTENSSYMSRYWDANNSYKPFRTGTITISQGTDGYPYIVVSTGQGNGTKQFFELTVGEPASSSCTYEVAFNANGGSGTMPNQEFTCGEAQNLNPNAFTGPAATITYNYHGATSGNGTPSVTVYKPFGAWEDSEEESLRDDEEEINFSVSDGATVTMTAQWNAFQGVTLPTPARTGYTFNGWYTEETGGTKKGNGGANFVPAGSITLHAQWTANTHNVSWVTDGNALTGTYTNGTTAYGTTIVAPATPTKDATAEYTYAFNAWSPTPAATMPDNDVTYTATWTQTPVNYTLTWDFAGGATATAEGDYTHGTVAYGTTIVAPANPTRSGYTFMGWSSDVVSTMPAANTTYTATWAEGECVTLLDNENDTWYDNFKTNHDGKTVTALYSRTFTQGRWSTLCLPFDVNRGTMMTQKLNGSVYEFKYATGDATVGDNVMLYFARANTMEAGKCYIVNANSALAGKSSFTFSKVEIDLTNDINDKDHPLNTVSAYNSLPETKTQGDIGLVGTLRKGTLKGETTGNTYMGLKDNKIWYPSTSAPGNVILAYRGLFRSTEALNASRVRIVVEGETVTELEVVNGELKEAAEARKFVQDGILYIERDGVIYNAQGQKVGKVEN